MIHLELLQITRVLTKVLPCSEVIVVGGNQLSNIYFEEFLALHMFRETPRVRMGTRAETFNPRFKRSTP